MKYNPSRDLPNFAREHKTLSPSKLTEIVLNRRNEKVTPESITMWFKRHSEIYEQLKKELVEGLPTVKDEVDTATFERDSFSEIQSVKDWILFMKTRRRKGKPLHPAYVKDQVRVLRFVCRKYEKHPERLTFRDAQEIFLALENEGKDSYETRRVLKDFLKSKGAPDWEKIGVGKPRGFGKYRTLFVEKPIVLEMLHWIESQDQRVYVADQVMWRNGLRVNAVMTSKIENFKPNGDFDYLTVTEKFREEKTFMLMRDVGDLVKNLIADRKTGRIFSGLDDKMVGKLNREALKRFVPELEPKIEMPSHFFRHMFFQHLLRACDWNSDVAAAIGQCTAQSIKESYGGAPEGQVQKWCLKFLPKMAEVVAA